MILQERTEPKLLLIYRSLDSRKDILAEEKRYLNSMEKGFFGEKQFDKWLFNGLKIPYLAIHNLLLEVNQSIVQIDSFVLTGIGNFLFEVKYLESDYYINEKDEWIKVGSQTPTKNPLLQVSRIETLLKQFAVINGIALNYNPLIIFNHPSFTLYHAPINPKLVFPTQLARLMKQLNTGNQSFTKNQERLAELLLISQTSENPYSKVPYYSYDELRKGLVCKNCGKLAVEVSHTNAICKSCNFIATLESSVINAIQELNLLFPDMKITTNFVYDWCGACISKKTIFKILQNNYQKSGQKRYQYFTVHE